MCIIGTRKPSARGRESARLFAEFLVRNGATVVSGLAMGIDTVAHRTTIACGGSTIAVLGTPLDKVNPPSNADLQREIGERYLLVSQFDHPPPDHCESFAPVLPIRASTIILVDECGDRRIDSTRCRVADP